MTVSVSVQDFGVLAAISRAKQALRDPQPIYEAIGRTLESRVQQRFDTKTDPSGQPWAAWSAATAARRKAEGRGTLLEYTGRLRDSLAYSVQQDGVEIGFSVPYAAYHEQLTPGSGALPQRSMLTQDGGLSNADADAVVSAALRALKRQMKLQAF